ncbi:hypothetical protein RhiirA5_496011 [Rhizophagus irregularis]|uniref:Uncharacterized protein n=1 Tax=Rhizophagus irregularis TaxID=588596 RepID=A0A2N0Q3I3_9GLOM|nr:hypothetical protein RhiirA5_496011 [Rhizophagus irregularis]GET63613.1 hypothetical protein GLOIN_2v1845720 [Rhizophagus irregularis DAOM 181602=DAOM 197198]
MKLINQEYLLPDRFLGKTHDNSFLVGNEKTQSNTKQYSNSTFKVDATKVENKDIISNFLKNVIRCGLYLRIKIYGRPILR